jgi:hypothetical protein
LSVIAAMDPTARTDCFPSQEELQPRLDPETGIDLSLIEENLKLTPWERVLANDDTINFIDTAREALKHRDAAT